MENIPTLNTELKHENIYYITEEILGIGQNGTVIWDRDLARIFELLLHKNNQLRNAIEHAQQTAPQQYLNIENYNERMVKIFLHLKTLTFHSSAEVSQAANKLCRKLSKYEPDRFSLFGSMNSKRNQEIAKDFEDPAALVLETLVPQFAQNLRELTAYKNGMANIQSLFTLDKNTDISELIARRKKQVIEVVNTILMPFLNAKSQLDKAAYAHIERAISTIIQKTEKPAKKQQRKLKRI